MSAMPDDADAWENAWRELARVHTDNPARRRRTALVREAIGRAVGAIRLVDLGCGPGLLLSELAEALPDAELYGVDVSRIALELARDRLPRARFVEADLAREDGASSALASLVGSVDVATCSEVLEHLDDPRPLLRAARVCLATSGRLIVTVPSGPRTAFDRSIGHRRHYRAAELRELLEGEGFAVERVMRAGFPFFVLYRLLVLARGDALRNDVRAAFARDRLPLGLRAAYALFDRLMRHDLEDTRWGWQLVAIARRKEPRT
jgi:SAM-dependent methyltransferase